MGMTQKTPNSQARMLGTTGPETGNEINSGQLEILNGNVIINARHGNDLHLQPLN